jgi:thiol peroxidase
MEERSAAVTMHGNPLTLVGRELSVGDAAPDLELLDNDLNAVKLSSFQGKVCVISAVPSLDTPVCDMETRRFNEAAGKLGDDVVILTVSMDLPFAQKRWCGTAFGVLIKELRLLGRSIFVLDRSGVVQYIQNVKELSEEPDYDAVIEAVQKIV